jgi:hypothetical protein
MYCAVNAPSAQKRLIRRVHDRICAYPGYIPMFQKDLCHDKKTMPASPLILR